MKRKIITDSYITSAGICSTLDDLEKYYKSGELVTNEDIRKSIAERLILMEKEEIRYALIFDFKIEDGMPEICNLMDRDIIIDNYVADRRHDGVDTVEEMCRLLTTEPLQVRKWAEDKSVDIFDDERMYEHLDVKICSVDRVTA